VAEDRIIPICKAVFSTLLLALALATPAHAKRSDERTAMGDYVRARAADASGAMADAAQAYSAVMTARPADPQIAARAYRQAMLAGDMPLAIRSARVLDAAGSLAADGRLLLMADAVERRRWADAAAILDRLDADESFDFLTPILRAWIALGAGETDPATLLAGPFTSALTTGFAGEHRALLMLATGRVDEGISTAQSVGGTNSARGQDFRLAAAARLLALDRRDAALSLLTGKEPAIQRARGLVEAGRAPGRAITTPALGIAHLLVRLAADINRDQPSPLALSLGRITTFLDPKNDHGWFLTAQMLASAGYGAAAVPLLERIDPDSPYGTAAADARVALLVQDGKDEKALAAALAAREKPDARLADLVRVGDLYASLKRYREAADAYDRAIAFADGNPDATQAPWTLWLVKGGALEQAGDWDAALPALEKAAELAPEQPLVLNYLGYAKLERREDIARATDLIARASALRPDDAAITDSLGWAYYIGGDVQKAIRTLERAVEAEPADATINEHLGDAYWTAGRRYEARYAWRAAAIHAEDEVAARLATKLDTGLTPEVAAP
jgi:tetratricopeptide (TPR) repeat protein